MSNFKDLADLHHAGGIPCGSGYLPFGMVFINQDQKGHRSITQARSVFHDRLKNWGLIVAALAYNGQDFPRRRFTLMRAQKIGPKVLSIGAVL
ncbi:MAG: hypothetical protein ABJH20_24705 [Rhizobiaceae bacterium]